MKGFAVDFVKKYLLLLLAGVSAIMAILFAFVIQLPTGLEGYTVSGPFTGGQLNQPATMKDYLGMTQVDSSLATLSTFTIVFIIVSAGLVVAFFVLRSRANVGGHNRKTSTVACPYCAEQIQPAAKVCRHCNKEL